MRIELDRDSTRAGRGGRPVFRQIADAIRADIAAGRLADGDRLPAIRELAKEPVPQEICEAYDVASFEFGREYIIPKPMDVRLLEVVPAAVARAAVDSGVARNGYPAHYPLKSMDDII